jgi:hypothetical protein
MPLNLRASQKLDDFGLELSYRAGETKRKFIDARNIFFNDGRLQGRGGTSRFNAVSIGASINSLSYFKDTSLNNYVLAKAGTDLYRVQPTGSPSSIKSGLTSNFKHRGITLNNRHIIAIENDGLFQYNGSSFTQLGQTQPAAPTIADVAGSGTLTATSYQVKITFYSSTTGFESNPSSASNTVTVTGTEEITVSAIPATAANATIDTVRVYLSNATALTAFFFSKEIALGTTTTNIIANTTSSQVPPTKNAPPLNGGGKYLTEFNRRLVYAGNTTFKNDVFFSEQDDPDAFDSGSETQLILKASGQGDITGLATGFFTDSNLEPFLVIFKKTSISIYSEIAGVQRLVKITDRIGCVSHDTIIVKNGAVMFLSEKGFMAIVNGRLVDDEQGDPVTLGDGDIDSIFTQSGYVYEVNKQQSTNFFSLYYSNLDQYMTFVSEGANNSIFKAYVWQFNVKGFIPYEWQIPYTCGMVAEDANSYEQCLLGSTDGYIYKHSIREAKSDVNSAGSAVAFSQFVLLNWLEGGDFDASYNFREFLVRALTSSNTITVKAFINFNVSNVMNYTYTFTDPNSGFVLDLSQLDIGVFSDERTVVTARADINRVGENILFGFYQSVVGGNMNLISAQIDLSKNGNRN